MVRGLGLIGDGGDGGDDDDDDDRPGGGGATPPEPPADVDVEFEETASPQFDAATGQSTATFGENSSVESVIFNSSVSGSVNVRTLSAAPDETGPVPGASVTVSQITVDDALADSSATIRTRVTQERFNEVGADAEDLMIFRFSDGEQQPLETEVAEETESGVILEAETPGFSYFAVGATSPPEASATVTPNTVTVGDEVGLDGSQSTTEYGEITAYDWSLNGESLSGETTSVTLDEPGEYTVNLTVTNDAGETDTATATVTVGEMSDGTDGTGDGTDGTNDGTAGAGDGTDEPAEEPAGLNPGMIALLLILALLAAAAVGWVRRNN